MCLRRPFSFVWLWIFLVVLQKNRVASRSPQQTSRLSDQNTEGRSLKIKGEKGQSMQHQTKSDPSKGVENRLASRNTQQTSRLSDQNTESRSLKIKGEKGHSTQHQTKGDPSKGVENRLPSRNPQQTARPSNQNSEARSLKLKGEIGDVQSMLDQTKRDPQDTVPCNCSGFCPHSNSSELQVN